MRGFTRDVDGTKHYIDHEINSIQNYVSEDTENAYQMIDVNVYQENTFHTKMIRKSIDVDEYLFGSGAEEFPEKELNRIRNRVEKEMAEIFYSKNMPDKD